MAELIELPDGWSPEHLEYLVRVRLDRELESALLRDRGEYARSRERMPAAARIREDRVLGGTNA